MFNHETLGGSPAYWGVVSPPGAGGFGVPPRVAEVELKVDLRLGGRA
jgi:hypothetical protein